MRKCCRCWAPAIGVFLAFCAGPVSAEVDGVARICIQVYNYADVPGPEMDRARAEAGRVLAQAGMEAGWMVFLADRVGGVIPVISKHDRIPSCGPTAPRLMVSVYPRSMASAFRTAASDLGFALLPERPGQFGDRAVIFYERLMALHEATGTPRALIFGYALVHEIGHLLLGRGSHSPSGIMRAQWGRLERQRAATGMLRFTTAQARRIRRQVLARQAANGSPLETLASAETNRNKR